MADFITNLVEMGFDKDRAQKAVEVTGNKGVEQAMEWLLSNPEIPSSSAGVSLGSGKSNVEEVKAESSNGAPAAEGTTPKSYKCEDCGKIFSNMETVEFHAAKTNHSNFTESTEEKKPLTAEEKAEQARLLQELLKQKRTEREAKEKREENEREKLRMASGKELADAKKRIEEQKMKEIMEERRREKLDDKKAKDRVKAMIEADKIARKIRFAGGVDADGSPIASTASVTAAASPPPSAKTSEPAVPSPKKDYKETRLQLRLPNGKTLTQTFGVSEPLASVRVYVELNRDDGATEPFNLMTSFPRKVFQGDDYDVPLDALGLVPSAVLMVTKSV